MNAPAFRLARFNLQHQSLGGFTDATLAPLPATSSTHPRAIGGAGTSISRGVIDDLEHSHEIKGARWYGDGTRRGVADQMVCDPKVAANEGYISDPVSSAVWDFEPWSDKPIDKEIADWANLYLLERIVWGAKVEQALRYLRHGASIFEVTDDVRPISRDRFPNHPGKGFGIVPTGLHQRLLSTISRFIQSTEDPAQLAAVEQRIIGSDGEKQGLRIIPASRILRFTWAQDGANFTGVSPLRACFGAWKIKKLLLIIDTIRHERQALGTPTMKLPEGVSDDDIATAAEIVKNMRANAQGHMVLRPGWNFEWSTNGANVSTNILDGIKFCNSEISTAFKTGFMDLGGSGPGSNALASTQEGNYQLSLEKHANFICRVINHGSDGWSYAERYIRLNYGAKVDLPCFTARNMPTKDLGKISSSITSLTSQNIITPDDRLEDHVREAWNLPARDPNTARRGGGASAQPTNPAQTRTPEPDGTPQDTKEAA